jgi:membrane-bound lytic murein transglycosylase D
LAALFIINDPERFGFDLKSLDPPQLYEKVTVSKQMRLKDIEKSMGVLYKDLEDLNPELRHQATPPNSYELKVPKDMGALLVANLDKIPVWTPPERLYVYHRVRRGETLSHLAARYRTSVRAITAANNIRRQSYIRAGQRLRIPTRSKRVLYAAPSTIDDLDQSKRIVHRVRRGDSLWLLARRYGSNTREIMRLNNLSSSRLHIGQRLVIREGTDDVQTSANAKTYRVKRGDSPYEIARLHNMTLERFLRINNLTPRSKIYPGQQLAVEIR